MINTKKDIVESYCKLINDCKENIENNINVDTNKLLLIEYENILNQVEHRPEEEYVEMENKINEMYEYSTVIYNFLLPIIPTDKRYNETNKKQRGEKKWLNLDSNTLLWALVSHKN